MSKWHEYHSVEVHILTCKKLKNAAGGKGSPMLGKREEDRVCCIINNNTIVMLIEDEIYASCKSSTLSTSEGDFCIGNSWGSYPQTWWFLRFFFLTLLSVDAHGLRPEATPVLGNVGKDGWLYFLESQCNCGRRGNFSIYFPRGGRYPLLEPTHCAIIIAITLQ